MKLTAFYYTYSLEGMPLLAVGQPFMHRIVTWQMQFFGIFTPIKIPVISTVRASTRKIRLLKRACGKWGISERKIWRQFGVMCRGRCFEC